MRWVAAAFVVVFAILVADVLELVRRAYNNRRG